MRDRLKNVLLIAVLPAIITGCVPPETNRTPTSGSGMVMEKQFVRRGGDDCILIGGFLQCGDFYLNLRRCDLEKPDDCRTMKVKVPGWAFSQIHAGDEVNIEGEDR